MLFLLYCDTSALDIYCYKCCAPLALQHHVAGIVDRCIDLQHMMQLSPAQTVILLLCSQGNLLTIWPVL